MNNGLVDVRGKLPQGLVELYRQVQMIAAQMQIEVIVVGAMARDLILVHGFNAKLERGIYSISLSLRIKP